MRIINTFKYKNKTFRAGELTVGDYIISLHDQQYFIEKVLSEFNEKPPKLNQAQMDRFISILFGLKDDLQIFKAKQNNNKPHDFHIILGIFMRNMRQGYNDVCAMPMRLFQEMLDDMECILDPSKYDPNRKSDEPDIKKFREVFGSQKVIKS